MKIQSASIDVPGGCPNRCKFCVSELTKEQATGMLENVIGRGEDEDWARSHYMERLEFLREAGVSTAILTGTASDPLTNMDFLMKFCDMNSELTSPFKHIEIQTSGVGLTYNKLVALDVYGIKTISLSLSSLDSDLNNEINGTPEKMKFDLLKACNMIKEHRFNLRLSLNMNRQGFPDVDFFNNIPMIRKMFIEIQETEADQVTFRRLYSDDSASPQAKWIKDNDVADGDWTNLKNYIRTNGRQLQKLAFGAWKYSIHGLSTVVDDDCMSTHVSDVLKYAILRRNCKLYSDWADPASLIF